MTKTITAFFDDPTTAERVAHDLSVKVGGVRSEVYDTRRSGEFSRLAFLGEDLATFNEGIRRGGAVLHAQVPDDQFDTAADVLEAGGAADIDQREAAWRREGWTGAAAAAASSRQGGFKTSLGATATGTGGEEERIPIVEERLRVGKREVGHGRVRIRSYVVETPVQEQVALREEHVSIERRPVDRPVTDTDRLFQERTIEATERAEEAVVAKEAQVKEELVIRKTAEEQTQTVQDTVRRTEVEVEDERRQASTSTGGTTTTGTPRAPERGPGAA